MYSVANTRTRTRKVVRDNADPRAVKTVIHQLDVYDDIDGWKGGHVEVQLDVCESLPDMDPRYNDRLLALAGALNDMAIQLTKGLRL